MTGNPKSSALPRAANFAPALFELRNYEMRTEGRDALIEMFERSFLDAYQAGGTRVIGTFRDVDDADRWVWMRAFRDATRRGKALTNFYASEAWKAEARPANATIASTRNVLLLRALSGSVVAAPPEAERMPASRIVVTIYVLPRDGEAEFARFFDVEVTPVLRALRAAPVATFVTDRSENSYPRQRVRQDSVFVTVTRFASMRSLEAFEARQRKSADSTKLSREIQRRVRAIEVVRLAPTARSALR